MVQQTCREVIHPPVWTQVSGRLCGRGRRGRRGFRGDGRGSDCRRRRPLLFGVLPFGWFLLLLHDKGAKHRKCCGNAKKTLDVISLGKQNLRLTCCASLAAAAARPVSTDATRAPSLAGRSCLGRVGITRAAEERNIRSLRCGNKTRN